VNILKMRKANQRRQGITFALGYQALGWVDETHVFSEMDLRPLIEQAGEFQRVYADAWKQAFTLTEKAKSGSVFIAPAQSGDVLDDLWWKH
jgi:hypothetical protein